MFFQTLHLGSLRLWLECLNNLLLILLTREAPSSALPPLGCQPWLAWGSPPPGSLAPGPWTERETPSRFGLPLPPHHPPLPPRVLCPSWVRRLPLAPCASCAGSPPHSSRADHLALSQPARRLQASEGGPAHVRSGFTTATPAMRRPWPKPSENRTSQRLRMAASAIRASNQLSPSRSAS